MGSTLGNGITNLLRIGIFYDGYYFFKVSNYYKYEHDRKARISISGLHEFIRREVALVTGTNLRQCQIIDAHYFKGRSSAKDLGEKVQSERMFEDILMRENIVTHYLPLRYGENNLLQEKGIDVWLALEAYELAIYKRFDIVVLVASDGDYIPLVRKLHTLGTQVMLICWDYTYHNENGNRMETKTSRQLLEEVYYPVQMHQRIDDAIQDAAIKNLFVTERNYSSFSADVKPQGANESSGNESSGIPVTQDGEVYSSYIYSLNNNGFGFIRDEENNNIFFHYSTVANRDFQDLQTGMQVHYQRETDEERSKKEGLVRYRARSVTVLE
ncbi:MAG: NYN domain-containing protein [Spirochaetales bacterium]|jgi:cold shock CspA family protein|nr:NYN domain-containing protein [Spirochaetales bacterium]